MKQNNHTEQCDFSVGGNLPIDTYPLIIVWAVTCKSQKGTVSDYLPVYGSICVVHLLFIIHIHSHN